MKSLHRNEIDSCGPLQIHVDNLALRAFCVVQVCSILAIFSAHDSKFIREWFVELHKQTKLQRRSKK